MMHASAIVSNGNSVQKSSVSRRKDTHKTRAGPNGKTNFNEVSEAVGSNEGADVAEAEAEEPVDSEAESQEQAELLADSGEEQVSVEQVGVDQEQDAGQLPEGQDENEVLMSTAPPESQHPPSRQNRQQRRKVNGKLLGNRQPEVRKRRKHRRS